MPAYLVTPKLEFSPDPLSDTTPTYVDITNDLMDIEWWAGKATDLGDPEPGGMRALLRNRDRRYEPEYQGVPTNLIRNPSFEVDLSRWGSAGAATTTRTRDTATYLYGGASQKLVTDGAGAGQGAAYTDTGSVGVAVNPGETWTASSYFNVPAGGATLRVTIEYLTSGGGSLGITSGPTITPAAGAWTRGFCMATAPATAAKAFVRCINVNATAITFYIDGVQMEQATGPSEYVDGSVGGGHWSGAAHDSSSYRGGIYYPNIDTERRFRLTLTDATGAVQQGVWYAESWEIDWPAKTDYSTVTVTAVDGFGLLANDTLDFLDPPEATSYEEVVSFEQPWGFYRLGEPEGTKLVSHKRTKKHKYSVGGAYSFTRRTTRRWKTRETRADVEGVAGPSGTYRNTPTLGEPGAILGDPDTSVRFHRANDEKARVGPLDDQDLRRDSVAVEAWVKWVSVAGGTHTIVAGPDTGGGAPIFQLEIDSDADPRFHFSITGLADVYSTTTGSATWKHVVGTFDGTRARIYVNGVLENTTFAPGVIPNPAVNGYLVIGGDSGSGGGWNGWLDEVAVHEKALSAGRIMAHYTAGTARGFDQQLTGARIAAVASSPLWSTASVDAGSFQVQPLMEYGQPKLDAILDAAQSERPRSLFFFDGSGNPIFKDFDALDGAAVAVTFGEQETRYSAITPVYDNEIFNTVIGSIDGGELQTATDAQSILDRKPRVRDSETSMPLADPDDVSLIISTIVSEYGVPTQRFASVSVLGADTGRVSHILRRTIGDVARVKRRGEGGVAIDRHCHILGYRKRLNAISRVLSGDFDLSRGFNAAKGGWHLGSAGFSELGTTTRLG